MCGITAVIGPDWEPRQLEAMVGSQKHRGPDCWGVLIDEENQLGLGHNRLSIIDLSSNANQPMSNSDQSVWLVFNGEIYNYSELRKELHEYHFRTRSDSEVILAAYEQWGEACLDKFIGMFAFVLWDARQRLLFAARDRFGVKPLYYHHAKDGTLFIASEIQALHAAGLEIAPHSQAWATYLTYGLYDHSPVTFWSNIHSLSPGHQMVWQQGEIHITCWYNLAHRVGPDFDERSSLDVEQEYFQLLEDSMRLRFRSDVPVGVNLSGGLDSSVALGLVDRLGGEQNITVFTYITGDSQYDELPWVEQMLGGSFHPLVISRLSIKEIPELAASVQAHQSEPFGGLPTLAYAKLFEDARESAVIVLCDGQGLDEQWAGYDYYHAPRSSHGGRVQGSKQSAIRPMCLLPEFRALAEPFEPEKPFPDALRNRQYVDSRYTKIPRVLRFNDRVSARASTELREPFLDHRLFEVAFRQPANRKIRGGTRKWLLRRATRKMLPPTISEAPKRPVQTPQREWLLGPLAEWTIDCIESALLRFDGIWLDGPAIRKECERYRSEGCDNAYFLWQWISLGLMVQDLPNCGVRSCEPFEREFQRAFDSTQRNGPVRLLMGWK